MIFKADVKIHNRFDVIKNEKWVGFAENIVLNQMYTRLCNYQSYFVNIHFGTGMGTPTPERTTLFTHLGSKVASTEEVIKALPTSKWTRKITLNPEEFVGSTITEVGIAYGSLNNNLVTHAMIKDAEGNPLSISKTELDVIVIYATVFVTFSSGGVVFSDALISNKLVDYLIGNTALNPSQSIVLYQTPFMTGASTMIALPGTDYPQVTKLCTIDVPNRKLKWANRFQITEGNMDIGLISLRDILVSDVKNVNVFGSYNRVGVNLGVGDGVKTTFRIPNRFISNLVVKIDGIQTVDFTVSEVSASYDVPLAIEFASALRTISSGSGQFFEIDPIEKVYYVVIQDNQYGPQQLLISFKDPIPKTIASIPNAYSNQVTPQYTSSILISTDLKYLRIDRGSGQTPRYTYISLLGNKFTLLGASEPSGVSWMGLSIHPAPVGYERSGFATGQCPRIKKIFEDALVDIVFNNPVPNNVVVTADYTTACIPKTSDYVLDVAFEIQFGEGT